MEVTGRFQNGGGQFAESEQVVGVANSVGT